jgi:DNA-binding NtrC family response regulator
MPSLRIFKAGELLCESRLGPGRFIIGRADTCDLALPDERISRVHCALERQRDGALVVADQSRHGTFLRGERLTRAGLAHGDRLRVGDFEIEVQLDGAGGQPPPTAQPEREASWEHLLCADDHGVGVERVALQVVGGPAATRTHRLGASDITVGFCDSLLNIPDPSLVPRHFRLLVNHGRVMVQPEHGAVTLDRERVRGLMPLLPGEVFSAGESEFRIQQVTDHEQAEAESFGAMLGTSPGMRRVFGLLRRMAPHQVPVLLQGESGTGKELAARGLHDANPTRGGAFVAINCAALGRDLFESELFGHEKGAFTGATSRRDGAFHAADGGTLFLDEVGEIPLESQAKLLRALESGEVRRVGCNTPDFPDVRVVAATNRDLAAEVAEGAFREDLFFRLAVLTVHIPPLRERPQDVPGLCIGIGNAMGIPLDLTPRAMALLQSHPWPGNVRELRNVLTRAYVLFGPKVDEGSLTFTPALGLDHGLGPEDSACDVMLQNEAAAVRSALARHGGNRAAAARELGLPRTTFLYKLRRLGFEG